MKRSFFAALLVLAALIPAMPQDSGKPSDTPVLAAGTSPEAKKDEMRKRRLEVIKYGMESELSELVKALAIEKDITYNDGLLAMLEKTRSPRLSETLVRFFADMSWPGAQGAARKILMDRDGREDSLIQAVLYYETATKDKEALSVMREMMKEENKQYMVPIVKFFGVCGETQDEALLSAYYEKDVADSVKQEIILALGGMGSDTAVDFLIKILDNADETKIKRMFAADSLGKLKAQRALPSILKAAQDPDAGLRQYAVGSAAKFQSPEVNALVLEAFRDSNVKVRLEAAKAAGALKLGEAVSFLVYRIKNDPEKKMKEDSLKALMAIGNADAFSFLDGYLKDTKSPVQYRQQIWALLFKNDRARSSGNLVAILQQQSAEKDQAFFMFMAREISLAEGSGLDDYVKPLLAHSQFVARICGLECIRKNKLAGFRPSVESMAEGEKVESVKKKAKDTLEAF